VKRLIREWWPVAVLYAMAAAACGALYLALGPVSVVTFPFTAAGTIAVQMKMRSLERRIAGVDDEARQRIETVERMATEKGAELEEANRHTRASCGGLGCVESRDRRQIVGAQSEHRPAEGATRWSTVAFSGTPDVVRLVAMTQPARQRSTSTTPTSSQPPASATMRMVPTGVVGRQIRASATTCSDGSGIPQVAPSSATSTLAAA
jgi:hypothetical protein